MTLQKFKQIGKILSIFLVPILLYQITLFIIGNNNIIVPKVYYWLAFGLFLVVVLLKILKPTIEESYFFQFIEIGSFFALLISLIIYKDIDYKYLILTIAINIIFVVINYKKSLTRRMVYGYPGDLFYIFYFVFLVLYSLIRFYL